MKDKLPQPTDVLVKRLRRAARVLRSHADVQNDKGPAMQQRAWANLCDQAAGRLEDYQQELSAYES